MFRFTLTPLHHRVLACVPEGEGVLLDTLLHRSGLRLDELIPPLSELCFAGRIIHESQANRLGGMAQVYRRCLEGATPSISIERQVEYDDEVRRGF